MHEYSNINTEALTEQLNQLIALERGALDACDIAAGRVDDLKHRLWLRDMVRAHLRRIDTLSRVVSQRGGEPTRAPADLPHDRVALRDLTGDATLLNAVLANQQGIIDSYSTVVDRAEQRAPNAHSALQRCVEQHLRLHAWLNAQLCA